MSAWIERLFGVDAQITTEKAFSNIVQSSRYEWSAAILVPDTILGDGNTDANKTTKCLTSWS